MHAYTYTHTHKNEQTYHRGLKTEGFGEQIWRQLRLRLKTELGNRVHRMGRSLEGDRWQDGGNQRSLGGIWEEGAGEVIGRSWERVLDAEY